MGMNKHNQGLKEAVQNRANSLVEAHRLYCDEGNKSESWLIEELEVGLFLEFYAKGDLDLATNKGGSAEDLSLVRRSLWKAIYDARREENFPTPRLAYPELPALSGILEPHIARRRDMKPSSMMVKAMEHLTSTEWHIHQDLFNLILTYREGLDPDDRQRIFYDSHLDFLMGPEDARGEKSMFDLLSRIGDSKFFIPWCRADQSGRLYPAPMHPVYSKFLRACMWGPSETLTEEGWSYLRGCIEEEFDTRGDIDAWSASVIARGIDHLIDHDKDGAMELSAAYGWQAAKDTGATGYWPYRDYAASGLGIMAAKEGVADQRLLVDTSHARFISAHDRLSTTLKSMFAGLRDASFGDLKAISKGILLPTQYAGGYRAIVSMLTGMETKPGSKEWDFGEFGDKLPNIPELLNEFLHGETVPVNQLAKLEKVCKRFAQAANRTFPFMRKYQTRIRSSWPKDWEGGILPHCSVRELDGWVRQPSPFRQEKRVTADVRITVKHGDTRTQPSVRVFQQLVDSTGIGECVRQIFEADSGITVGVLCMHADEGIMSNSIHDARACHPNHGYRMQAIETIVYDKVMGTSLADAGAVLVRA